VQGRWVRIEVLDRGPACVRRWRSSLAGRMGVGAVGAVGSRSRPRSPKLTAAAWRRRRAKVERGSCLSYPPLRAYKPGPPQPAERLARGGGGRAVVPLRAHDEVCDGPDAAGMTSRIRHDRSARVALLRVASRSHPRARGRLGVRPRFLRPRASHPAARPPTTPIPSHTPSRTLTPAPQPLDSYSKSDQSARI